MPIKPKPTRGRPKKKPVAPKTKSGIPSKYAQIPVDERFVLKNEVSLRLRRGLSRQRVFEKMVEDGFEVSKSFVYRVSDELHKEWIEAKNESFDIHVAKQIAKLDLIEDQLWQMFDESKRERIRTTLEFSFNGPENNDENEGDETRSDSNPTSKTKVGLKSERSDQNPNRRLINEKIERTNSFGELQIVDRILNVWDKRNAILGIHTTTINIQQNIQNNNIQNNIQPVSDKFFGNFEIVEDVRIGMQDAENV